MSRERAQALLCDNFGPFGKLDFPYIKMGNIDSLHLFGDTELMILAMYWHNRDRWKSVLDIGANLGLHSICMARMGFEVKAYEPDPEHYKRLIENLRRNASGPGDPVIPINTAVHTSSGTAKFIRVLNNLTGNHLEGYKDSYGPKQEMLVNTVNCRYLWPGTDFAKIDSEGNEAELCKTMTVEDMRHMDCVLEIRNAGNARYIYNHFSELMVPMWAQRIDWGRVHHFDDMPKQNRDGSLFVGHVGPWA